MSENIKIPGWVKNALRGIKTRKSAFVWLFASILLALLFVTAGLVMENPTLLSGGLFVFAALWYFLAIRWMDSHQMWTKGKN